jgi:hypothetical protein
MTNNVSPNLNFYEWLETSLKMHSKTTVNYGGHKVTDQEMDSLNETAYKLNAKLTWSNEGSAMIATFTNQ